MRLDHDFLDGGPAERVRVEYLIVVPANAAAAIGSQLRELLSDALDANQNDVEPESLARMLIPDVGRLAYTNVKPLDDASTLFGFAIELPPETTRPENVVEEFTAALSKTPPITHALKFYDSLVWRQNVRLAEEIFELEMQLRRVLSLIYLHRSPAKPYELLRDETEQPMAPEKLTPQQLAAGVENEFFHLTFGQYPKLNQRRLPTKLPDVFPLIQDSLGFEHFRDELRRMPVENEDDQLFIAGLKDALGTLFTIRNGIAHNRTVPRKALENYEKNARPALKKLLNEYLERWAIPPLDMEEVGEMTWEFEARRAIEQEIAGAEWNSAAGVIRFPASGDDPHARYIEITNRESLAQHLEQIGEEAWIGFRPSAGGDDEPLDPDVEGMVKDVMEKYSEQIDSTFTTSETSN